MNAYDPYRYYIKIRDGTIIIDEKEYPNIIEKRCFYNKAAFKKSFKELSEKEKDEYEKNRNIYKERFALPE